MYSRANENNFYILCVGIMLYFCVLVHSSYCTYALNSHVTVKQKIACSFSYTLSSYCMLLHGLSFTAVMWPLCQPSFEQLTHLGPTIIIQPHAERGGRKGEGEGGGGGTEW